MTMAFYIIASALAGGVIGALLAKTLSPRPRRVGPRSPVEQVEFMRNLLAFLLVAAFVSCFPVLTFKAIPSENKDLITYMLGQLSGMATMALGFYFVNKAGQDAADAEKTANTGKLADLAKTALETNTGEAGSDAAGAAADQVAGAAADEAEEIKHG